MIAWCLANRTEVDAELLRYEAEAGVTRAELERSGLAARDLRARLVRRGPGRPG